MVGEPFAERRRHLRVAEDAGPFAEVEISSDDNRCLLAETADQVKEKLPAGLGEGEIAELIPDQEVETAE